MISSKSIVFVKWWRTVAFSTNGLHLYPNTRFVKHCLTVDGFSLMHLIEWDYDHFHSLQFVKTLISIILCLSIAEKCHGILRNYLRVGIPYSGHFSTTDIFPRNGWNDGQSLITKHLCSRTFMADNVRSHRTDLSKAGTPNNKLYKRFHVRNLYIFYFRQ